MSSDRWRGHPVLGALVRILVVLVPVAVSLGVSLIVIASLPIAHALWAQLLWWTAVLGTAWLAAVLVDRVARRAVPLAVLLELSLVFPDRAPSRLRAARGMTARQLETQLNTLRKQGAQGTPIEVAETLVTLVGILGLHDPKTRGHSERVRAYVDLLSEELQLPEEDRLRLRWAALIHDLGKLTVPTEVLNGGKDLPAEAWLQLHRHPDEGERLASGLLPWLGEWGASVRQHHEWWDGNGYPLGLSGEQISRGARIVSVADAFEVMTANRSYSRARSAPSARTELSQCAGTQFDPAIVRAFLQISIGRLRWVLGPLSWLSVLPFVANRAMDALKAGAGAAGVAALVVAGAVAGPGGFHNAEAPFRHGGGVPVVHSASPTPSSSTATATATATATPPSTIAPTAAALASASPSPTRTTRPTTQATQPGSTPSTTPRGVGAPATRSYYVTSGGLSSATPTGKTPTTVTLTAGGASRSFDLPVGSTPTTLSGSPVLAVYDRVLAAHGQGNVKGLLTVTLLDCTSRSGPCTQLSTSTLPVGTARQTTGYRLDTGTLTATSAVVRSGHVLRMTLALQGGGSAATATLAFAATSTPSRLALTAAPPPP